MNRHGLAIHIGKVHSKFKLKKSMPAPQIREVEAQVKFCPCCGTNIKAVEIALDISK